MFDIGLRDEVLEAIRVEQEAVVPFDFEEEEEVVEPPVTTLPIVVVVQPTVVTLPTAENQLQVMKSTSAILTTLQEMQKAFTTYMTAVSKRLDKMEKSQGELLRLLSAPAEAPRSEVTDSRRSSEEPQQQQPDIIDQAPSTEHHRHNNIDRPSSEHHRHNDIDRTSSGHHRREENMDRGSSSGHHWHEQRRSRSRDSHRHHRY